MQCKKITIELVNNSNEDNDGVLRNEKKHKRKNLPDQPPTFVIFVRRLESRSRRGQNTKMARKQSEKRRFHGSP
ncbi:hypothetical protein V495_07631 [Pseudogymnoascus sp. VKM F-4514 (FW-929)]|nr:hypothetical protein V495_07631 [Pseudogymnoascus sp. VKM F-4514 (FW-929)]KFY65993.1 hypothetical protein V497_01182 [Pseudogymnoascus sp. VKM F-4516 (FW-969)]